MSLQKDVKNAIDELKVWIKDNPYDEEPSDYIFELSDNGVPVYNSDIMDYAADNYALAINVPEIGPAFDGTPTPINIIAANIFEYIHDSLWEYWNDERDNLLDEVKGLIKLWMDEGLEDKDNDFQDNSEEWVKWCSHDLQVDKELVEEIIEEYKE